MLKHKWNIIVASLFGAVLAYFVYELGKTGGLFCFDSCTPAPLALVVPMMITGFSVAFLLVLAILEIVRFFRTKRITIRDRNTMD